MAYTSVLPVHRLDRSIDYVKDRATAILNGFKDVHPFRYPLPIKEDRVHFRNGTYFVNQKFINRKEWTQNRLTVNYNKDASKPKNG